MEKKGSNQAKREKEIEKKKKKGKARTFLEALWPLSLQPPERRRRETKQKAQEKNEPKRRSQEGREVQSKRRSAATGQAPSQTPVGAFRGPGGPAENAALLWPGEEGRGTGACPTKGKRLPLSVCDENTHSISIDKLSKDD